jgi:hypothetical protein
MKRFWMVALSAVCLSGLAMADLEFPDSIPGTTVVLATNGTEYLGIYGGEENGTYANGGCCAETYIFTYQTGIYTSAFPLPYQLQDGGRVTIQLTSSGAFAGYYDVGVDDRQFAFASICPSYDCLNQMTYKDFFANEVSTVTVGGVEYEVYSSYAAWDATTTTVDEAGDVIGTFNNFIEGNCDANVGLPVESACIDGTFAVHDGSVYLDYQIAPNTEFNDILASVNEFTFDGKNLSVPEPSSIWLLAPGLMCAIRLRKLAPR